LRNLEAGSPTDLSRETVAELNDSSSGDRTPTPTSLSSDENFSTTLPFE
jgi:hypothetical protein